MVKVILGSLLGLLVLTPVVQASPASFMALRQEFVKAQKISQTGIDSISKFDWICDQSAEQGNWEQTWAGPSLVDFVKRKDGSFENLGVGKGLWAPLSFSFNSNGDLTGEYVLRNLKIEGTDGHPAGIITIRIDSNNLIIAEVSVDKNINVLAPKSVALSSSKAVQYQHCGRLGYEFAN